MSSLSKASPSKNMTNESPEESGWTTYFEDFFNNRNIEDQECTMSFTGVNDSSSSLVSDAASLTARKLADSVKAEEFPMNKSGNKSSLRKRKKIKTALVDDTLEDTASSPVNSPKVLYKNQLYTRINGRKKSFLRRKEITRDKEMREKNWVLMGGKVTAQS